MYMHVQCTFHLCIHPSLFHIMDYSLHTVLNLHKQRSQESVQMTLMALLQAQSPAIIYAACLASDVSLLRTYLQEHPEQVSAITTSARPPNPASDTSPILWFLEAKHSQNHF